MAEVAICLVAHVLSASVDHMAYVAICHLKSWRTWALPPLGHARQQATGTAHTYVRRGRDEDVTQSQFSYIAHRWELYCVHAMVGVACTLD